MPRRSLLILLLVQATLLGLWAALRIVNADEGIVLQAARRVAGGERLYGQVFFMHPPLTAYLYAPVAAWGWAGLFAGRALSLFASLMATVVVAHAARRLTGDGRAGVLAFALFALDGLTLAWHPTVTTLVWADLLGVAGMFLLAGAGMSRRHLFLAGVLVGLAASARLTHGVLGVAALAWVFADPAPGRMRRAGVLAVGGLSGFAPALLHAALDPSAFWLDVAVFRQVWGAEVVAMPLAGKLKALGQFVLYPQSLLVLALFVWSARRRGTLDAPARRAWSLYASAAAVLAALYLVVTPTQTHYFAQTLPYLVIASAPALARLAPGLTRPRLVLAGVLYAACIVPYALLFVAGARPKDQRYRLATVRLITHTVQACTAPGDSVLSFNQHVPVLAGRPAARGLEVGGPAVVPLLSPAHRRQTGLFNEADLRRVLAEGNYPVVVYEPTFFDDGPAPLAARYRRAAGRDSVAVYVRQDVVCS